MKTKETREISHAVIMLFLCVCVLSQMLGTPITLVSLLTSADLLTESVSEEDFSIPVRDFDVGTPSQLRPHIALQPSYNPPAFQTSIFHPPVL